MKFFNVHVSLFLKSSLLVSVLMSMPLAAAAVNESQDFLDESAVHSPSEAARKKKCKNPRNARFNNITACNALIKKDLTVNGNETIGGNLAVAGDTALAGNLAVTGNETVGGNLAVTGNETIGGNLAVAGDTALAGNLAVTGNETVGGDLAVTGNETVGGNLTVDGNEIVGGDLAVTGNETVGGDLTVTGTTNLNGQVNNNIGGTYTIYSPTDPNYHLSDFPTIQAGIDFVSSGLKPNSNVTLQVMPGVYNEALAIDTSLSDPSLNDPFTDVNPLPLRGLRILGDQRPIAAMTYMNGGFVESDPTYFHGETPQSHLGQRHARVTLTNPYNTNTLSVSLAPIPPSTTPVTQPNFETCGVMPGDQIFFSYPSYIPSPEGNIPYEQRTVVSVYPTPPNTEAYMITYDGNPLLFNPNGTIGNGACLTFVPNVQIAPLGAPVDSGTPLLILDGVVEMIGFYLNAITAAPYSMRVSGTLIPSNILAFMGESGPLVGGKILLDRADDDVAGHMTLIDNIFFVNDGGYIANGDWYIVRSGGTGVAVGYESAVHINSLQINGVGEAGSGIVLFGQGGDVSIDTVFVAYNCIQSLQLASDNVFTGSGAILIDAGTASNAVGINAYGPAQVINEGSSGGAPSLATGYTSSISNVESAITTFLSDEFSFAGPLTINNAGIGIT